MSAFQGVVYPSGSLYVGDLHPDVTEAVLYEKFNRVGQVLSLRVCRDARTRQSLGYGYVNYNQVMDAERAMDTMNFDLLKGKPIRIMWCHRDPSLRKSGIGNVFIKNLDRSIDNKAMFDTFSAFGNILSCKVAIDDNGHSKGYGFVHFENEQDARKAIEKVNGMLLNGKKVFAGKFIPRVERERELGERAKQFTNIYVKNFGIAMSDERFLKMFNKCGEITSWVVMRHIDGSSKGFGFVAYRDAKSAQAAIEEYNGKEIDGKVLYLARAQKKIERYNELKKRIEKIRLERYELYQGVNLYIKNLDDSFDDERLHKEFAPYGTITSAKVMRENGRSKGFGFVCFTSTEEATKAVAEMNGKMIGNKPLYVGLAQRKEERRAYLNSQHLQRAQALRIQNGLTFPTTTPPFLFPTVAQGPRFFNHINSINHIRPTARWPVSNAIRPNGTYNLALINSPHRVSSRTSVNTRNSINARPITGQQTAPSRPNSKYTNSSNNSARPAPAGVGNGGDIPNNGLPNVQDQKQLIGEQLFTMVHKMCPEISGKITGMLLEIDNSELLHLLENKDSLKARVDEAIAVLQAHNANLKKVIIVED
ncbi:polyadenylate-binding protein 4-like [Diabrotica virgifera virgifera]|uniref:Polyadenylate-binding protein n=1 Tax=Diabrotica virgifera virgifera TaxID=50390 RepID=A0A6P7GSD5_DIAVI|nr:polyadenylate-binding protein 4-like [Diabrotica virgifera virgifera]